MANTSVVGNENLQYYDEKIKQYNATAARIGMVKPDGTSILIDTIADKGRISVAYPLSAPTAGDVNNVLTATGEGTYGWRPPKPGDVEDVIVDGNSVVVDRIAYIPKATDTSFGVVKTSNGIDNTDGVISVKPKDNTSITVDADGVRLNYDPTLLINTSNELAVKDPIPGRTMPDDMGKVLSVFDDGTYGWNSLPTAVIDTEMSDISENAVQNKVIKAYVDNPYGDMIDGETKPVAGGVIKAYVDDLIDDLNVDEFPLHEKSAVDNSYKLYGILQIDGKIAKGVVAETIVNDGTLTIKDTDDIIISNEYTANTDKVNTDIVIPSSTISNYGLMKTSSDIPAGTPRLYDTFIDGVGLVRAYNEEVDEILDKAITAVLGIRIDGTELSKDADNKIDIPIATETIYGVDKKYTSISPIVIDSDNIVSVKYDDATIKNGADGLYAVTANTNLGVVKMDGTFGLTSYTSGAAIYIDADGTIKGNYLPGAGITFENNFITATGGISLQVVKNHEEVPSPSSLVIYLEDTETGEDIYYQWVWFDGRWHNIGTTRVSLRDYDKIEDRVAAINALNGTALVAMKDATTERVTIKNNIAETAGVISDGIGEITLSKVASTGMFGDLISIPNSKLTIRTEADSIVQDYTEFTDNDSISGDKVYTVGNGTLNLTVAEESVGTFNANTSISKTINIPTATSSRFGVVKADGNTTEAPDGVIRVKNPIIAPTDALTDYVLTVLGEGAYAWKKTGGGTITDVRVDGVSVVTGSVADIDLPSVSEFGIASSVVDASGNTKVVINSLKETNGEVELGSDVTKRVEFTIPASSTVDTSMSDTSTNPVENRVIKAYVDNNIHDNKLSLTYKDASGTSKTTEFTANSATDVYANIVDIASNTQYGIVKTSNGIDNTDGVISVKPKDNTGITVDSNGVGLNHDNTLIVNTSNELKVKDPIPNRIMPDDTGKVLSVLGDGSYGWTSLPSTTVDDAMSDTSTNAVQNKVIKKYVDDSVKDIDVDEFQLYEKSTTDNTYKIYGIKQVDGKIVKGVASETIVNDGVLTIKDPSGVIISNEYTANTNRTNTDITIPSSTTASYGLMKTSSDIPTGTPRLYDTFIDASGQVKAYNTTVDTLLDKAGTAVQGVKINGVELSKDIDNKIEIPEATITTLGVDKKYTGTLPIEIDSNNVVSVKYDNTTIKNGTDGLYVEKAGTNLGVVKFDNSFGTTSYTTSTGIYIDNDGMIKGNYQPGAGIMIDGNYITATGGISLKVTTRHEDEPSPSSQVIYLEDTGTGENIYTLWVYFNGEWHNIGTTRVSLLEYDKIVDRTAAINALNGNATIATKDATTLLITIKGAITENSGIISNSGTDITLSKVSTTGSFADLNTIPNNKLILRTYADDIVLSQTEFTDNNLTIGDTTFSVGNAVMTLSAGGDPIGDFSANATISKVLDIPTATSSRFGVIKVDGTTIVSPDGVAKVVNPISSPTDAQTNYVLTVLGENAYAWKPIEVGGTITDVKVDGASVVVDDVAYIDLPTVAEFGIGSSAVDASGNTIITIGSIKETNGAIEPGVDDTKKISFTIPAGSTVDTSMSDTSTNPVQNKVIKAYVDDNIHDNTLTLTYKDTNGTSQTKTFTANSAVDVTADIVDLASTTTFGIVKIGSGMVATSGILTPDWATDAEVDAFGW